MKKTEAKKTREIFHKLQAWADALNLDPSTIKRKLNQASIPIPAGGLRAIDIFRALTAESDKDLAATRKLNAEAEKTERENLVDSKELFHVNEIEKLIWHEILSPLRSELMNLPRLLKDPESQEALQKWVDETLVKIGKAKK